ncbi:MAG: HEAT repeat domain-containing protein [Pyrinomonadaceae bacterium]
MSNNGNDPNVTIKAPTVSRVRATWPILLLAVLFVVGAFLTWYFTWFGRELSDSDISKYLVDEKNPRHVQHALLQIQQRIERKDTSVKQWYPRLITLAGNPETELRLTVAWLMGFDNQAEEFHSALLKLLTDPEPIVRRNAALALVRFNDSSGRQELRSILKLYPIPATAEGVLNSTLRSGSQVSRGTLLARIQKANNEIVEVRSPLLGQVENLMVQSGASVREGELILNLKSDEESVWEALRGLAIIGQAEDVSVIQHYLQETPSVSERIKEQAALTIKSIQSRKI